MSPSFDAQEFRRFCAACYELRRAYPSLTVSAVRTVLTVAKADSPMTYQELADLVGQKYVPMAHQIAALSDGRDGRSGLGLLVRLPGRHERARLVACSGTSKSFVQRFVVEPGNASPSKEDVGTVIDHTLSAVDAVLHRNPKLSLGTLCAFLYVATNQKAFAYEGLPAGIIASDLGLSNLPMHLRTLEQGIGDSGASRLIGFHVNEYDQRVRLPYLTKAGLELQCELVKALTQRTVKAPKLPSAEALDRLGSPDEIINLSDDDFREIVWD